ncbi:MAG: cell division protein FtsZ, partial [Myxococcota bacterium]
DANIIWGASVDEGMGEMVKVTVIATGFDQAAEEIGVEQEAQRPTMVNVPQQIASSRPATHAPPARATALPTEEPAITRRRAIPATRPVTVSASRSAGSAFPAEMDWDTPAYTRRNGR